MPQVNQKVIAIESMSDGVLKTYGEGEYLGDLVPDTAPFKDMNLKNPCIKLDSGGYVWGFQSWWGDADKVRKTYYEKAQEIKLVEPPQDIKPLGDFFTEETNR